jgi:hypothetical protein
MSLGHSPSIATSGLVLCLDAGNTRSYPGSGTAWTDLSGNANNGTLVNIPTYSSTNGGILTFNGSTQYGSTPLSLGGYTAYTVAAWIKTTTTGKEITSTYGAGNVFEIFILNDGKLGVYAYGATLAYRASTSSVATGSWVHCAGVYQGSTATLNTYVNGVLANGTLTGATIPTSLTVSASTVVIGNVNSGSYFFNGSMGQISIYNRALSAAEIAQNYNALRGRYGL